MSHNVEVSMSLTRLHKVVERIKALVSEQSELVSNASEQYVNLAAGFSIAPRLRLLGINAIAALDEIAVLYEMQTKLRTEVSQMNEKLGISDLLAQMDAQAKLLKLKRSLVPDATAMYLDDLEVQYQLLKERDGKPSYENTKASCLSVEQVAKLNEDIRALQASSYALSDKLAALNASQVKVTLPEGLAKQLGLV